jgi:hypothetical protein
MKKPETRFRERFVKKLKKLPNTHFFSIQQVAIRGVPDLLGLVDGRFVALELKASSKANVTELQKIALQKIAAAGGIARVVYPENELEILGELECLLK